MCFERRLVHVKRLLSRRIAWKKFAKCRWLMAATEFPSLPSRPRSRWGFPDKNGNVDNAVDKKHREKGGTQWLNRRIPGNSISGVDARLKRYTSIEWTNPPHCAMHDCHDRLSQMEGIDFSNFLLFAEASSLLCQFATQFSFPWCI